MSISIISPKNSFVQFSESDAITSCEFPDISLCLPVYLDDDISFQFILQASDEAEADTLCDLTNDQIEIGVADDCSGDFLLTFTEKTERYRISPTQVLYNWAHGLPAFGTVIAKAECFIIKVRVQDTYTFCSNCLQRISDPCHTSVVDYGNDDDAFGFDYCGGSPVTPDQETCTPTIIQFSNQATMTIPYTASLQAKYGTVPSVSAWIRDETGELVQAGIRIDFDDFPPTVINLDFGGTSSGIVKIS